jgi:hypothetical protein
MLCSRTILVREMLGNKDWVEEDDMVSKLCDPDIHVDTATSEGEWSSQPGSEKSGSEESYEGNDDNTSTTTSTETVKTYPTSAAIQSASTQLLKQRLVMGEMQILFKIDSPIVLQALCDIW